MLTFIELSTSNNKIAPKKSGENKQTKNIIFDKINVQLTLSDNILQTHSLNFMVLFQVAILGKCSEDLVQVAYEYGRNFGVAFQLVDDLLDFISTEALMGKPTAADLKLGLATAPVLFAAQQVCENLKFALLLC